ncbi:MAG: flavodoxin-dependent (E)-4-hydroxy-3-methylbut-2-enyl-diphosphate synthase [Candidatus Omnitrophota bacterium]|jgi:(E)-4-hydroxy-3-methylbut-2-enyl-diphosphate synthase|nr:flavodoxin-dependent (E)-4-hydroxy-3-methylbut-2-enyl-diphosphate synthase [Candidatus Omnitrophota bacterium]
MRIKRRKSRVVKIGSLSIGGANPIAIQSMAKCKTSEVAKVIRQVRGLEKAGCEIVRLAVKDSQDAAALKKIKRQVKIPLVADIHFDYRLALEAIESGVDKIRLNPGNIYKKEEVKKVVSGLKAAKIPLRIGLNSGSVKDVSSKGMPDKLVNSALGYIRMVEGFKFYDIVVSLKASDVLDTVSAYKKLAKLCDYPLHLGVTATGSPFSGALKTSVALGALLLDGIGDTIRVSLTDEPVQEVYAARCILEALGLRNSGVSLISCPTCGRCEVDLVKIVRELEEKLEPGAVRFSSARPLKVAVMGCVVNGPGEAKEADIGVAFGKSEGLLFKKGKPVKKIAYSDCVDILLKEMAKEYVLD